MNKHTLGPWTFAKTGTWPDTNHDLGIYSDGGTGQVAKVEGWGGEATANARLIAAAPELLEALQAFVQFHSGHVLPGHELQTAMAKARAALSKAEGGGQ